jgi:hypothetical protein
MDQLTRLLSALLRHAARSLPADRREWAQAAWAEAAAVPAGRCRLAWLAGGLWVAAGHGGTLRRATCWLAFGAAVAAVVRVGWPGAAASPATLIDRVDVIAVVALLAGLPWAAGRLFGPVGGSRLARALRAAGYAAILALVLVKASVEHFGNPPGGNYGGGLVTLWVGEVIFLVVITAYVGGILAVTARRPPAAPPALAIGTAAGALAGLVMYARIHLHVTSPGLAAVSVATAVLTWAVLLGTPIVAGLVAVRRTPGHGSHPAKADDRPRQGVAAGWCAGITAALVVSVLETGTAALLPHQARLLSWAYPIRHLAHGPLYRYEVGMSQNAAIYIFVLVFFPLLGAGLGAWGGLTVAGRPGSRPGGSGGGGPSAPPQLPPPPPGGRARGHGHQPRLLHSGGRVMFPAGNNRSHVPEEQHPPPGHRERIPITVSRAPG